jgi:hypothetical protein
MTNRNQVESSTLDAPQSSVYPFSEESDTMKKLFTCLGVVFAVVIVVTIVIFVVFIPRALHLSDEASTYLDGEVPKIVQNWNSQELIDAASPELSAGINKGGGLDQMFTMFRQLGALKHLDQPSGGVRMGASTEHGSYTVGNFSISADFESGPAEILVQVLKIGDTWKINGFRINSNVFLSPKADAAKPVNK